MGIVISTIFDTSVHRVVLLGLDGAGKTTVLYRLKWQEIVLPPPTVGFNCEKFRPKNGLARGHGFLFWDVEGQDHARSLWRTYLRQASAVIFVIDASDESRFEEVKTEIEGVVRLKDLAPHAPIIFLGNKQDKLSAVPADEVAVQLREKDWSVSSTNSFMQSLNRKNYFYRKRNRDDDSKFKLFPR